jgi:hypothetical protein
MTKKTKKTKKTTTTEARALVLADALMDQGFEVSAHEYEPRDGGPFFYLNVRRRGEGWMGGDYVELLVGRSGSIYVTHPRRDTSTLREVLDAVESAGFGRLLEKNA